MLIFSPNITLTAADAVSTTTPLIGWRNVVTILNVAASTEDVDFPAVNLANPSTVLKWLATDAEETFVTVTFDDATEVDYVGIARHNFGSSEIAVRIEGSYAGVWSVISDEVVPPDDTPLIFRFDATSPEALRVRMAEGDDAPTMAVLYVGRLTVMERGINLDTPHTPFRFSRVTNTIQGRSEAGDYLGSIVTGSHSEMAEQFSHISASWYRSEFDPFAEAAIESPFFYAWRPSEYPLEVGYAKLTADIQPQLNPKTGRFTIQMSMWGLTR